MIKVGQNSNFHFKYDQQTVDNLFQDYNQMYGTKYKCIRCKQSFYDLEQYLKKVFCYRCRIENQNKKKKFPKIFLCNCGRNAYYFIYWKKLIHSSKIIMSSSALIKCWICYLYEAELEIINNLKKNLMSYLLEDIIEIIIPYIEY